MSKITKTTRVYLTIEVEEPWKSSGSDWAQRGRSKVGEIKNLIGAANIDHLFGVNYEVESPTVCSLCGEPWEEDADGPMCCTAAVEEWRVNQPKAEEAS